MEKRSYTDRILELFDDLVADTEATITERGLDDSERAEVIQMLAEYFNNQLSDDSNE